MKRRIFLSSALSIAVCLILATASQSQADTLTNEDFVGDVATVTLPTDYTIDTVISSSLPPSGLFDGVSDNLGNGRVVFRQNTGLPLSPSNFISISADLKTPFIVESIELAHDWGGAAAQEIIDVEVLLNGASGVLATITASDLNDGVIADIDEVASGLSVGPVTSFEFRVTDGEGTPHVLEIREIVISGRPVPEPTSITLTVLLGLGAVSFSRTRRRS